VPQSAELPGLPETARLESPENTQLGIAPARSSLIDEVLAGAGGVVAGRGTGATVVDPGPQGPVFPTLCEPETVAAADDFEDARTITCASFTSEVDLSTATVQTGEQTPCGKINESAWYRFAPKVTQTVSVLLSEPYDPLPTLGVFTGSSPANLRLVRCFQGTYEWSAAADTFKVARGDVYYLQVGLNEEVLPGVIDQKDISHSPPVHFVLRPVTTGGGIIQRLAGAGSDNIPATKAYLANPTQAIFDAEGNLYIADSYSARVRRVARSGIITTVAGNGEYGAGSGDGGPAVRARVPNPVSLAFDSRGNLYISDNIDSRVRKVDRRGVITTVAGSGTAGYSGDGGPATAARLNYPVGIVVDRSDNLLIADAGNGVIRKVDRAGRITTFAGKSPSPIRINSAAGTTEGGPAADASMWPWGLALDRDGNVYVAEADFNRIRKIDRSRRITTVAGSSSGGGGFDGDGGAATKALLNYPQGVWVDPGGRVVIADTYNERIRVVDTDGIIRTIAGNGRYGFAGDGGPALGAEFGDPAGVTADDAGRVFISDAWNGRIRVVEKSGIIHAVAGAPPYIGDGSVATASRLAYPTDVAFDGAGGFYLADTWHERIRKVDANGVITTVAGTGAYGFDPKESRAVEARLADPGGVAVDTAGNLFIADTWNYVVRKVDRHGVITTVAGTPGQWGSVGDGGPAASALLNRPADVAVDREGNLYIADTGNSRIRKVDTNGTITTVAGNPAGSVLVPFGDGLDARLAGLFQPEGLVVDADGNLFIADTGNNRVRKVDTSGVITTVAGSNNFFQPEPYGDGGPATEATLRRPTGLAIDREGNLLIADTDRHRIRKVNRAGTISTVAGTGCCGSYGGDGDGGPATSATLNEPRGIAVDAAGVLLIADSWNDRVREVFHGRISSVAGSFVNGELGDGGRAIFASVNSPQGVVVDDHGNVYFADTLNKFVRKIDHNGIIVTIAGARASPNSQADRTGGADKVELASPMGLALDARGNLYISDNVDNVVRKLDRTGRITTFAGGGASEYTSGPVRATEAKLSSPQGLAVDAPGNVYIAESGRNLIRKIDASGMMTTVAGGAEPDPGGKVGDRQPATKAVLSSPTGIAVDREGNLYIADTGNERVRKVDHRTHVIDTIAGTGEFGFEGDGRAARSAKLQTPTWVAVDRRGNVLISDSGNARVRQIDRAGTIATVAGNGSYGSGGDGGPATLASLGSPRGVAVDALGSLYIATFDSIRWIEGGKRATTHRPPLRILGRRLVRRSVQPPRRVWDPTPLSVAVAQPSRVPIRPNGPRRGEPVAVAWVLLGAAAAARLARRRAMRRPAPR
jgi:sugar lactone lactonase YvrE